MNSHPTSPHAVSTKPKVIGLKPVDNSLIGVERSSPVTPLEYNSLKKTPI
jgi:hypothetical protein